MSTKENNSNQKGKAMQKKEKIEWKSCGKIGYIALTEIVVSDDFRCRESGEDDDTVERYTEVFKGYLKQAKEDDKLLKRGANVDNLEYPFPPAWVWRAGDKVYLIAGFHRYKAAEKSRVEKLLIKEFKGTKEEAILFAMKDNRSHGLRLSYGDLKYCVEKALRLLPDKTPGAIAKEIGCHRSYAYKIEKELSTCRQLTEVEKREGADGKVRSVRRKAKKSTIAPPSKPSKKPFVAQPTIAPPEVSDSIPKPDAPNDKREATSEPPKPIPQDDPESDAPFEFDTPPPVVQVEAYKPASKLEVRMNGAITFLRDIASLWLEQDDRRYIVHRLKEYITELEADRNNTTPSNSETVPA